MTIKHTTLLLFTSILLTACPPPPNDTLRNTATAAPSPTVLPTPEKEAPKALPQDSPKNIILMIGDGMGVTQISAGLYMNGNRLNLERFPVVGLHKSYSGDNLVTDSAAGATAFSSGTKTYNGAIGVGMDTMPVKTILEMAEARGMPTGLISTSSIVHATPASFAAHNRYRKNYEEIALDMSKAGVDLMIGGGLKYFNRRKDDRDLTKEMRARGSYVQNFTIAELDKLRFGSDKPFCYLTADSEPLPHAQGRDYLPVAAALAPPFLDERAGANKGFFLMIEGSQIDWGGHANDSDYIISEMLEFDRAVGKVLDWAEKDGETLIIITADHETGGYAIQNGSKMGAIDGAFTSDYHTADLIPVFAFGPGAANFAGIYENTAIFDKMKKLYGFD